MTYDEYKEEVKALFAKSYPRLTDEDVELYINSEETEEIISLDYKSYVGQNLAQITPGATASCLYMLY